VLYHQYSLVFVSAELIVFFVLEGSYCQACKWMVQRKMLDALRCHMLDALRCHMLDALRCHRRIQEFFRGGGLRTHWSRYVMTA